MPGGCEQVLFSSFATPLRLSADASRFSDIERKLDAQAHKLDQLLALLTDGTSSLRRQAPKTGPANTEPQPSTGAEVVINHLGVVDGVAGVPMAQACVCGNVFKEDSRFCRSCGKSRPTAADAGEPEPKPDVPNDKHVVENGESFLDAPPDDSISKIKGVLVESDAGMLNPKNSTRMTWDLAIIAPLLLYLAIFLPFRLCFDNEPAVGTPEYWFEFMIDMVFIFDILLSFRTGIFVESDEHGDDGEAVEYDRWRVAKDYVKSWFLLDVFSGIPFALIEILMSSDAGALKSAKSLKTLKVLRILKLGRLLKVDKILKNLDRDVLDHIEDFLSNVMTKTTIMMVQLLVILLFACHVIACGWVLIGRVSSLEGFERGWLAEELDGPFVAEDTTGANGGGPVYNIYVSAFYFAITTVTSVGYGDINPMNTSERLFVIVAECVGAIVFATIIAAITSVVSGMDVNKRKTEEQLNAVSSFVVNRNIPGSLGRRIRRHFRHFYSLKSAIDETKIFRELSASLRKEVSEYLVAGLMGGDSFFKSVNPTLWPRLLPMLRPTSFEPGEFVCTQGEECTEMYVVLSGLLTASTTVAGEAVPRVRRVGVGGSINVLHVLGVWNECVETAVATEGGGSAECYALSSRDFRSLFAGESGAAAFKRMQKLELRSFKVHPHVDDVGAVHPFGKPL